MNTPTRQIEIANTQAITPEALVAVRLWKLDCLVSDPKGLQKKLEQSLLDGFDELHVVSDFDRTLTPNTINGQKASTSVGKIREWGYLTKEYPALAYALYDQYHPIETDSNIPVIQKKAAMQEWRERHFALLIEHGMNKPIIEDVLKKFPIILRSWASEFFRILHSNQVPLLLFSAGLGDMIRQTLTALHLLTDNVHLLSNFFVFDGDGRAVDYTKPVIHVFNKDEGQVLNSPYSPVVQQRKNVILLGDTLWDTAMLEWCTHQVVIKIGYCHEPSKSNLELYSREFDCVLLDDQGLEPVIQLLRAIGGSKSKLS